MQRISYTKRFQTGTLKGLVVPVSFTTPDATETAEWMRSTAHKVRSDTATGSRWTIEPGSVEVIDEPAKL